VSLDNKLWKPLIAPHAIITNIIGQRVAFEPAENDITEAC